MHMLGEPGDMQDNPQYQDVTKEVGEFLAERMLQLVRLGRHSRRADHPRSGLRLRENLAAQL